MLSPPATPASPNVDTFPLPFAVAQAAPPPAGEGAGPAGNVRSSGRARQVPLWRVKEDEFVAQAAKKQHKPKQKPRPRIKHQNNAPPTPASSAGSPPQSVQLPISLAATAPAAEVTQVKVELEQVAAAPDAVAPKPKKPRAPRQKATPAEASTSKAPSPPTPSAESESESEAEVRLPSFIGHDELSCSDDSSEDEDCYGLPKPPKPASYDSKGLLKIRPSYYYDADYDPAQNGEIRKRRARKGGFKGVPVFEPTMAQFEAEGGFYGYVRRIEKYGMRAGIVKVIPPREWSDKLPPVADQLHPIRLREPISQHTTGSQGLYRITNVAKSRIWNAAQWKDAAVSSKWAAPDFVADQKKADRTDRASTAPKRKRTQTEEGEEGEHEAVKMDVDGEDKDDSPHVKRRPGRPPKEKPTPAAAPFAQPVASTSAIPSSTDADPPRELDALLAQFARDNNIIRGAPPPDESDASKAKVKRISPLQRAEPTEEEWCAFVDKMGELPHGMNKSDYTVELMREVERRYWRTLTFGEPAMYGADMKGSLFTNETSAWNVAHLGDLLPRLAPSSCKIPGVVSPYLYFGMWRATFAWHVEDADLYSINFIHFGAPKFWYSVPQEQSKKFERVMEGYFPTDRKTCGQFLRHKSFLASPRVLANSGINLNRVAQMPGEFILTYPKGYHSGFNLGYNCAESINFATERWLPLGREARACSCIGDSVNIDVDEWLAMKVDEEDRELARKEGRPWKPRRRRDSTEEEEKVKTPPAEAGTAAGEGVVKEKKKRVRKAKAELAPGEAKVKVEREQPNEREPKPKKPRATRKSVLKEAHVEADKVEKPKPQRKRWLQPQPQPTEEQGQDQQLGTGQAEILAH